MTDTTPETHPPEGGGWRIIRRVAPYLWTREEP